MTSDIKLDGDTVVVEGRYMKAQVLDLWLDSPDRRINTEGVRRAIVHDFGDKLTINYNRDYPGGVGILGTVALPDEVNVGKLNVEDIKVAGKDFAHRVYQGTGQERLVLGNENDPVAELRGAGLQVYGKFGVKEEAYFTNIMIFPPPLPVPHVHLPGDVSLPPGWSQPDGSVQPPAYSLLERITKLEVEIATLKEKVAALEHNPV